MPSMSRFLPFVILAAVLRAQAPPEVIAKIVDEGNRNSRVMELLDGLVNGIGPRLTGSDNLTDAVAWARDKFKSFGIENARIEEWGTFPVGFNRGPWRGRVTAPEAMDLEFTTPAWSPGTKGPASGPVRLAPASAEEFEAGAASLKGSWILGWPRGLERQGRDAKVADAGILGVIESARAGFAGKEAGTLVITGGNQNVDFDALPRTTRIQLQGSQYDAIRAWLDEGKAVEATIEVRNHFEKGPIPLYNVLAEIRGTELPDELVIVGGHIDSWDGATGTTDNGTGTATTLEAARLLMVAGARPRRTIRFMLWSGEEQGLLGSRAYIKAHPEETDRVSACLVHDGGTNYVSGIPATEVMFDDFTRILEPLTTLDPEMPFTVRKVRSLPYPIGSDHDSYTQAGAPGFFWNQAGRANYTHTHHTQFDTYDAAIPEYQRHTSKVVAIGSLAIANLPQKLNREGMRGATTVTRGPRRRLGVDYAGDDTLEISEVVEGSVAQKAGFKVKDRILKVDGKAVKDRIELRTALADGEPSKKLTLLRDGQEVEITVSFPAPSGG